MSRPKELSSPRLPRGSRRLWICSKLPASGNPHLVVRLDPALKAGLEAYALAKGLSVSQLVRRVLLDFAHEVASSQLYSTQEGVEYTLDRIKVLVGTLEVQWYNAAVTGIPTQKHGGGLYDTVLALFKEVVRLAQSEATAKNVSACIDVMRLANALSRTALSILSGCDRRDIERLMDELKNTSEPIQARLRARENGTTANTGGS
jgi:hypothetical protein